MEEENLQKYRIHRDGNKKDILLVPATRHRVTKYCIKKSKLNSCKMTLYIIYCFVLGCKNAGWMENAWTFLSRKSMKMYSDIVRCKMLHHKEVFKKKCELY